MKTEISVNSLLSKFPKNAPRDLYEIYSVVMRAGYPFIWQPSKRGHGIYITGKRNAYLHVSRRTTGWVSAFSNNFEMEEICKAREKKEVFREALHFARLNRAIFVVCDAEAEWANEPATHYQFKIIQNAGYDEGIDDLTKGQVAALIASGAFFRNEPAKIFQKFI